MITVEVCGQTHFTAGDHLAESSLAEVKVKQENPGTLDCKGCSDVKDGEGLSGIRIKRGNHHTVSLVVTGTAKHGIEIGTKNPEGFVDRITLAGLYNNLGVMVVIPVNPMTFQPVALDTHLRNFGEERNLEAFKVTAALDTGIKLSDKEEDTEGDTCAQNKSDENNHLRIGRYRTRTGDRRHDHTSVGDIDQRSNLVLLTFLEKVDIQLLLDLLLTLDGEEFELLSGGGRHSAHQLILVTLEFVGLELEGCDKVVDGTVDSNSQRFQAFRQVNDNRVFVATAGKEHVTLDDSIVVLADTCFKGGRINTGSCRDNAVAVLGIVDPALNHLCDGQLVVNFERLGSILRRLGKIELRNLLEVGDAVLLLVILEVLFHAAKFLLDNSETVVDKCGGVAGVAVLIVNPLLVIHIDS